MTNDNRPSLKDILKELAELGVSIEALKEASLYEKELKELADKLRALMKKQKTLTN